MQSNTMTPPAVLEKDDDRRLLEDAPSAARQNPRPVGKYNLVVLGAGPAGILAACAAAGLGAKVALIERNLLGGTCLNTGCIPSKSILRTSRLYADMRGAESIGAQVPKDIRVDFAAVMARMRHIRSRIGRRNSAERLSALGIDVYFGAARLTGPNTVAVDGTILRFRKALIATGSRPLIPPIPGLVEAGYLTHENVFDLTECPRRLLVIGGGPLGCELAQAFCRFGSRVTIVQKEPMFLRQEERDAAQILSSALARDGVDIHLNTNVVNVRVEGSHKLVDLISDDNRTTVIADQILVGVGRTPNVQEINLEAAGVEYDDVTGVRINDFLQTTNPRIYASGDVCLEHKFMHIEDASAHLVVRNALFWGRRRLSKLTIPWCTYTDPEIAHVGLYVTEAIRRGMPVKTFTVPMHDVDRAIADGEEEGFVKIHVKDGTDKILGATVVARHAGEMINDISLAIASGIGLRVLARVIHPYPTQAIAIQMAADSYNNTRLTPVLKWLLGRWLAL
jgi:pyruvate/2-oxoglutarate dehydrogenase complex dihydrolipoamide dehydrogenase (E3) component